MIEHKSSWKTLFLAAVIPLLIIAILDILLEPKFSSDSFKRFSNAVLTSYLLVGLILTANMFLYAGSRKRPLAPIISMVIASLAAVGITVILLNNGGFLMEHNSSLQAQILYNIVHMIVTLGAMGLAGILAIGSMFAIIVSKKVDSLFHEEE